LPVSGAATTLPGIAIGDGLKDAFDGGEVWPAARASLATASHSIDLIALLAPLA
jgi:hypothetical protein